MRQLLSIIQPFLTNLFNTDVYITLNMLVLSAIMNDGKICGDPRIN